MSAPSASADAVDLHLCHRRRIVAAGDRETRLPDLSFRLLTLLAAHAPEPVAYAEIEKSVWGAAVTRDTMKQRIKLLRDSLASIGAPEHAIEAVRNAGYRTRLRFGDFLPAKPRRMPWRPALGFLVAGTLLAAVALWQRSPPSSIPVKIAVESGETAQGIKDSAMSGIHRVLIRDLSKIEGVRIIDQAAAPGADTDADLEVTLALVPAADGIRLSAQLLDRRSRAILYAEHYRYSPDDYERALQHFVNNAHARIAELSLELGRGGYAQQDEAIRSTYLQALTLWRTGELRSLKVSREMLEKVVSANDDFLLAESLLARVKADLVLRHGVDARLAREAALEAARLVQAHPGVGDFRFTQARAKMALGDQSGALLDLRIAQQTMPFLSRDIQALERQLQRGVRP